MRTPLGAHADAPQGIQALNHLGYQLVAESLVITDRITVRKEDLVVETPRSGGPGGQHANTSDTRVRIRFNLAGCDVLHPAVKKRIRAAHPGKVTSSGELLVTVSSERSQKANLEIARKRLAGIIRKSLKPPKPRRPTRPTRGSKERRLATKKKRGSVKKGRGRVSEND